MRNFKKNPLLEEEEVKRLHNMYSLERNLHRQGYRLIAGVDEVGRGPLAGPVVAAAVIFARECYIIGLKDSKQLTPGQRDNILPQILQKALSIGVGIVSVPEIDRININKASLKAMSKAVERLSPPADSLLIDGSQKLPLDFPTFQCPVKKGDSLSFSIAAASIIAKVVRDRIMVSLARRYPDYGFDRHKGYPTVEHREAVARLGPLPIHRRSFKLTPGNGNQ